MTFSASSTGRPRVGFACSYTPLPLIHAAGFDPVRILPEGDAPDLAGTVLHDNLCPHVKRILDRQLAGELDDLVGTVFVNSCDAMRRLAHAFAMKGAPDRVVLLDLPVVRDERAKAYFASELERLLARLAQWPGGRQPSPADLASSASRHDHLVALLERLAAHTVSGTVAGGRAAYQRWVNRAVTAPLKQTIDALEQELAMADRPSLVASAAADGAVPLLLFGNVLSDPAALELIESCGARVVGDDLCTGSRQLTPLSLEANPPTAAGTAALLQRATDAVLSRPICARMVAPDEPEAVAQQTIDRARRAGARGVIAHVMKFCDPYLIRMPAVHAALRREKLPLLLLEGDCTLRSLGQHRTRIEAFVEQLAT